MATDARDIGLTLLLTGLVAAMVHACDPWGGEGGGDTYPLIGEHADVPCEGCHDMAVGITILPTACESCHLDDKPEPHSDAPCEDCHSPNGWLALSVDHGFFPLEDAHDLGPCTTCHDEDTYYSLDPACQSCHEEDRPDDHFDGADCAACHTPTAWENGELDHDFLPLEDAHDLDCFDCHDPDDYGSLEDNCQSCHEAERPDDHFDGADCETCHAPTDWGDGYFNHDDDFFPIPHEGNGDCGDCHLNDDGYETFSCIDCHEHNEDDMDDEHDEVGSYVWQSSACLDCHPDGDD